MDGWIKSDCHFYHYTILFTSHFSGGHAFIALSFGENCKYLFRYLSDICSNFNFLEPPTISNGANRTLDVEEGDDVPLHCDANGDPIPLVTWRKDGRILQQSNTTTSIFITDIELRDAGTYVCTAKNRAGSVSQSILVSVIRCEYYLVPSRLASIEF